MKICLITGSNFREHLRGFRSTRAILQECVLLRELPPHAHYTERCSACHPHPGERETKRRREGKTERETGRWRDGDEGAACSGCLDVNNAPEGSAENCQLLIFVVSFNHLRLRSASPPPPAPPTPPFTNTLFYLTPPHAPPLAMQRST